MRACDGGTRSSCERPGFSAYSRGVRFFGEDVVRKLMPMFAASMLASAGCTHTPPPLPTSDSERALTTEQLRTAMPAVVLLLNRRPNGDVGYGSGLLLPESGKVLTSLHVVNGGTLHAMLYREGRVSYTPMDGGLSRYVFENAKELVAARLVKFDEPTDLAVVEITADTSKLPRLSFSSSPPKIGERVFALGHPQETVWSFTTGVVNALHHGAVQHDAVVSHGSSGGPLLNARGEVVGINTAKVLNEARGMAFARPSAMVTEWLESKAKDDIDFTSLEKAVAGCWRAQEIGSPALADCFDLDRRYELFLAAHTAFKQQLRLSGEAEKAFDKATLPEGGREGYARVFRRGMLEWLRSDGKLSRKAASMSSDSPLAELSSDPRVREVLNATVAEWEKAEASRGRMLFEQNGLKISSHAQSELRRVLRMGIRIDDTQMVGDDTAWVRMTGRNIDGSQFAFSEVWHRRGARWSQRSPPSPGDLVSLPASWPKPIESYELAFKKVSAQLAMDFLPPRPAVPNRLGGDPVPEGGNMSGAIPAHASCDPGCGPTRCL